MRLISVWLILCFGLVNISQYIFLNSVSALVENLVFCFAYFLFSYLVIHLFYFIKTKKFQKVLDEKIGWGDIWLILLTGCCIAPVVMIYFFTLTFVAAVLIQFLFLRKDKTIALAGMLVICYSFYLVWFIFS